ncbi:MAG: HU family DNA-binding protein [Bacteroidetes bacterium]|nr:HU family DNA-binding protein [Bacteroidota bacterium]
MNKAILVDAIAQRTKLSKTDSRKALEAFLHESTRALARKQRVALVGFGSFSVVKRKARIVHNPQNGQPVQIKARWVVKFHTGAALASKVN